MLAEDNLVEFVVFLEKEDVGLYDLEEAPLFEENLHFFLEVSFFFVSPVEQVLEFKVPCDPVIEIDDIGNIEYLRLRYHFWGLTMISSNLCNAFFYPIFLVS